MPFELNHTFCNTSMETELDSIANKHIRDWLKFAWENSNHCRYERFLWTRHPFIPSFTLQQELPLICKLMYTSRCTTTSGNVCWNGFDQNLRIWTVKCSWTRSELGQFVCWPGSQTGEIYISAWIQRRLSAQCYDYTRVFEVGEFQYCLMQAYIRNTPRVSRILWYL